jgi:hypothetical protein
MATVMTPYGNRYDLGNKKDPHRPDVGPLFPKRSGKAGSVALVRAAEDQVALVVVVGRTLLQEVGEHAGDPAREEVGVAMKAY